MARVSPVTWLVAIAVALIATFVGSTILVEHNAGRLDGDTSAIADNAAPSIAELAAARTEMRRLELGVGRYLGAHWAGQQPASPRAQIDIRRSSVDAHLAAHARLPMWPGELELTHQLKRVQDRLFADIDRVLADVDAGRTADARATMLGAVSADGDDVDRLLTHLISINTDRAAASARNIAALRQRTSSLALLLDAISVLLGVVLVLAAVRAARLYHRALVEQRRLAEARASELDHFAARVAHDLKAPLASVVLGTTVAAEYPSETRTALEKVLRTSRLMSDMIDALLDVARVEPERCRTRTPIAQVLEVIVDEVRPTATEAEATLKLEEIPPRAAVACSAGVLASVLSNLLQNAVKYIKGAAGERRIAVSVCEKSKDAICICVKDTGPGLPPELESHVFERYVRGAGSTGLGLGLATVKHLVESVGGRLGVDSKPGQGTVFWVELPRANTHEARVAS
jgi:signal transduction histidine kinase